MQVLFLSVLLVKFSVEDGKSHWMSGLVLIGKFGGQSLLSVSLTAFSSCLYPHRGLVLACP